MSASGELTTIPIAAVRSPSLGSRALRGLRRFASRQPVGMVALLFLLLIVVLAVFADYMRTTNPQAIDPSQILKGPSWAHWFGTNRQGNDVWSRVVYGARPSLIIGVTTVVIGLGGGCLLGLISGYFGGWIDFVIGRITEFVIAFPPIIVGIVVAAALKPGIRSVIIAITIVVIAATTRLIRSAVLQQRTAVYVEAARVIGAGQGRVVGRHILPNILPLAIVVATALLPTAILFESAVTFLGFGLPQGEPSWGADLGGQTRTFFQTAPWLAIFPGIALSLTILAFNMLGDALRDELDPRLRNRG
jgi:peptide/nickel transport system permease protein